MSKMRLGEIFMPDSDMKKLKAEFTKRMYALADEVEEVLKRKVSRFRQMLDEGGRIEGGYETAKALINKEVSTTFADLTLKGKRDLTVEAEIRDNPKWHRLFTDAEMNECKRRLK